MVNSRVGRKEQEASFEEADFSTVPVSSLC